MDTILPNGKRDYEYCPVSATIRCRTAARGSGTVAIPAFLDIAITPVEGSWIFEAAYCAIVVCYVLCTHILCYEIECSSVPVVVPARQCVAV